jgi:hypothetical protein
MARELTAWRRRVLFVGFSIFGLMSLAMGIAMLFGVTFTMTGQRFGPPRPWSVVPTESPVGQIIGAIVFTIGGVVLLWRGVKALLGRRTHTLRKGEH